MERHDGPRFNDLLDALQYHAERDPDRTAFRFVIDEGQHDTAISFGELWERTVQIGSSLSALTEQGERVLLTIPPSLDFIPIFWGTLWAGLVPCFMRPPTSRDAALALAARFREIRATLLIGSETLRADMAMTPYWAELQLPEPIAWETLTCASRSKRRHTHLAFLQFTSGSTGTPKGVRVTRQALAKHCEQARVAFGYDRNTISVSGLPVHHCHGLFTAVVCPAYVGHLGVQIAPERFLQQPLLWLKTIARCRATTSSAPNSAYDNVCRTLSELSPAELQLDLSGWRHAGMGGDVTRPELLYRIGAALAPFGFRPQALKPAYGLSEATMFISGDASAGCRHTVHLDAHAFRFGRLEFVPKDAPNARGIVSVGPAVPGCDVVLVEPNTSHRAAPDSLGEILVSGPALADGYWERPMESEAAFGATLSESGPAYLRTGDLGFLYNGELFVVGRCKELIPVRDIKVFLSDIEASVRTCGPETVNAAMAAFAVERPNGVVLGIAIELSPASEALAARIFAAVARDHQVACDEVTFAQPGLLPRNPLGRVLRLGVGTLAKDSRLSGVTIRRNGR